MIFNASNVSFRQPILSHPQSGPYTVTAEAAITRPLGKSMDNPEAEDLITEPREQYELHARLREVYFLEFNAMEKWGLETIKTLFLLNGVGLTGLFGLAAASRPEINLKMLPFGWFAVGIILSVMSMVFARYGHDAASNGWHRRVEEFADLPRRSCLELGNRKSVARLMLLAHICGWTSGACCLWAGWELYKMLFAL